MTLYFIIFGQFIGLRIREITVYPYIHHPGARVLTGSQLRTNCLEEPFFNADRRRSADFFYGGGSFSIQGFFSHSQ